MSDPIPARFRKTKTGKWAVMAPIADLEAALAAGGKVDVLKKSGDWSTFQVASLGKPFDVDGVQMCYGYGPEEEGADDAGGGTTQASGAAGPSQGQGGGERSSNGGSRPRPPRRASTPPPPRDDSEPMPEFQGGAEDEWHEGF
ncbi:MAG: hypothetical protein AAF467_00180 [Actinomycetota bacterium]